MRIKQIRPEDINILKIRKKCEKCGHIHEYQEVWRSENKYAVLHFMISFCPKCEYWNQFSIILDENGNFISEGNYKDETKQLSLDENEKLIQVLKKCKPETKSCECQEENSDIFEKENGSWVMRVGNGNWDDTFDYTNILITYCPFCGRELKAKR